MLPGLGPAPQFMDAVFTAAEKSPPRFGVEFAGIRGVSVAGDTTGIDSELR